jgi:ATP/maltotriose-dependent transcriptional regulator MalT
MNKDSQICDLVGTLPDACFKHAESGKYILVGDTLAARYGVSSPSQMVGLTVADMGFARTELGRRHTLQTERMDALVRKSLQPAEITRATLLHDGDKLVYETVKKIPVAGERGVLGILTFARDLTPSLPHTALYALYKRACGSKQRALGKTLVHLEIAEWFFQLPTEAEWLILAGRSEGKSNKEMAVERRVSVRTVETHIDRVRSKLRGDVLPQVIHRLRRRSELAANANPDDIAV